MARPAITTYPLEVQRERFLRLVQHGAPDECWIWTGKTGHGYGRVTVEDRAVMAHRRAYELFVGPIPDGLVLRHSCGNRPCVNPHHLTQGIRRTRERRLMPRPRTSSLPLEQQRARFIGRVNQSGPNGCWLWEGSQNEKGYGLTTVDGQTRGAHRRAYELFVGPIPDGMEIRHECDVRRCVNPAHLRPGTHRENIDDVIARRRWWNMNKTHCVNGHAFTRKNTIVGEQRGNRRRSCRECARAAGRRFHHKHKKERADYMRDYYQRRKEKAS